jgi:hypothetical protein
LTIDFCFVFSFEDLGKLRARQKAAGAMREGVGKKTTTTTKEEECQR